MVDISAIWCYKYRVIVDVIVCHKSRTRVQFPATPPIQYTPYGVELGSTGLLRMKEITGWELR